MSQYYDNFLTALEARYRSKQDLVNALTDLLGLEKESVYRRLRKDVFFSVEEVMRIAGAWSLSLDNLVCTNPDKTRPFHFKMIEYADPLEADYNMLEQYNRDLELVAADPAGCMYEVLNSLPRGLYCRSETLTRFFTMKWLYKYGTPQVIRPLGEIVLTRRMREIDLEHIRLVHSIPQAHSVHDSRLFENVVDEIVYFRSIGMVTDEETATLRVDLLALIDYVEEVTTGGVFPTTGNKMFFYLSHRRIDTEYVIYESQNFNLTLVKILERNAVASVDKVVADRLKNMVQSMKHSSVLMSGSNALQQAEYFARQRDVVMTL